MSFYIELLQAVSRAMTGRFLSDGQITAVTSNVVGHFLSPWLAETEDKRKAEERITAATQHIAAAANLVSSLQSDLEIQTKRLQELTGELKTQQELVDRYQTLAASGRASFDAYRAELSESIRAELEAQNRSGRGVRRAVSFSIWSLTLVLGAVLGAYIRVNFEPWLRSLSPAAITRPSRVAATPLPSQPKPGVPSTAPTATVARPSPVTHP